MEARGVAGIVTGGGVAPPTRRTGLGVAYLHDFRELTLQRIRAATAAHHEGVAAFHIIGDRPGQGIRPVG